jgi:long-chain acyl-CoA synthetase
MDEQQPVQLRRFSDALAHRATQWGERIAHRDAAGVELTFEAWNARADALGGGLAHCGVAPGDRILLPFTNASVLDMACAYMGAHRAGAVCVPVNPRWTRSEVAGFAELVDASWAVTDVPELLEGVALKRVWRMADVPARPHDVPEQDALPGAEDDADLDILPTSGTTATPKGVVATEREMVASMRQLAQRSPVREMLHALPITGYGGLHGLLLTPLRTGTTVTTMDRFDVDAFLRLVEDVKVDAVYVVPAMLRLLLRAEESVKRANLESLRWIFVGASMLSPNTVELAERHLPGVKLINTYAATEFGSGNQTRLDPAVIARKPGAVGKPLAGGAVEIRDPDGRPVANGVVGTIWMKSLGAPRRYWNDPEATARTWQNGWVHSGDLGLIDKDGDLVIVGRTKEIVNRGGINIAPAEIEHALHDHPSIREAAVVGIPHEVLGEDLAAAVVLDTDTPFDETAMQRFLLERLARHKVPRIWIVLDQLPRNPMGKVVKFELVERAAEAAIGRRDGR